MLLNFSKVVNVRSICRISVGKCVYFKIHTSCSKYVRRVAVNPRSCLDSVGKPSKEQNDGSDFFGIESDVGVIYANTSKSRTPAEKLSNLSSSADSKKERVVEAPYGIFRFDSDNQPVLHGQFEENIEEVLSANSNSALNIKIGSIVPSRRRGNLSSVKEFYAVVNKKVSSESVDVPLTNKISKSDSLLRKKRRNVQSATSVTTYNDTTGSEQSKGTRELGFIDSTYFDNAATCYSEQISNGESNLAEASTDDIGFIDSAYFGNVTDVTSADSGSSISDSIYRTQDSGVHGEHKNLLRNENECSDAVTNHTVLSEETSYIDANYFDNPNSEDQLFGALSEVLSKKEAPTKSGNYGMMDSCTDFVPGQKADSITCNSFIDSLYFGAQVEDKDAAVSSKYFKGASHDSITENINYSSDTSVINAHNKSVLRNDVLEGCSGSGFLQFNEKDGNSHLSIQDDILRVTESIRTSSAVSVYEKGDPEDINSNFKVSDELVIRQNGQDVLEETQCPKEEISASAYDYVLQLRKNMQKQDDHGDKKSAIGIFKDKIPQLHCLTQNELLEQLKECVLFSNDDIVILNKPYNLVIHESQTTRDPALSSVLNGFASMLDKSSANPQLFTVHRLDKETTGCLILARNEQTARKLKVMFAERQIQKIYLIVTSRVPDPVSGVIDIPIAEGKVENRMRMALQPHIPSGVKYKTHVKSGRKAVTSYKVISTSENAALVEVEPKTGVKHQIRVHFGFGLNCPVLGDHKYSHLTKLAPQRLSGDVLQKLRIKQSKVRHIPMHIHSRSVMIPQILDGEDLFVTAPLPEHLRTCIKYMKFK